MVSRKSLLPKIQELRELSGFYLELKKINGRYYVFKSTSIWDKEHRKRVKKTEYFGKISDSGEFIEGKHAVGSYGTVDSFVPPDYEEGADNPNDLRLLRMLSMDARVGVSKVEETLNLKKTATTNRIRKLEIKYGIHYMAEIDQEKLGYSSYLIFLKFNAKSRDMERIRLILSGDPMVQLAATLRGGYDLLIYYLAENDRRANFRLYELRKKLLPEDDSEWIISQCFIGYGFIPLRDEFFEEVKGNVWHRSKDSPKHEDGKLYYGEYATLRELCRDGAIPFAEIDKKHSLNEGNAQYSYYKLMEKGIIKRITISESLFASRRLVINLMEILNAAAFEKSRPKLLSFIISESGRAVNTNVLEADLMNPYGIILVSPMENKEGERKFMARLGKVSGVRMRRLEVKEVMVGSFCYRNFDNSDSNQYRILKSSYQSNGETGNHSAVFG